MGQKGRLVMGRKEMIALVLLALVILLLIVDGQAANMLHFYMHLF